MKRTLAVILAAAMTMGSLAGCGGSGDSQTTTTAAQGGQESSGAAQESGEQKETAKATGEKQKIEFWYHAADEQSTAMFEKIFEELNA